MSELALRLLPLHMAASVGGRVGRGFADDALRAMSIDDLESFARLGRTFRSTLLETLETVPHVQPVNGLLHQAMVGARQLEVLPMEAQFRGTVAAAKSAPAILDEIARRLDEAIDVQGRALIGEAHGVAMGGDLAWSALP